MKQPKKQAKTLTFSDKKRIYDKRKASVLVLRVGHNRSVNRISTASSLVSTDSGRVENNSPLFQLHKEKKCLVKAYKCFVLCVQMVCTVSTDGLYCEYRCFVACVQMLCTVSTDAL